MMNPMHKSPHMSINLKKSHRQAYHLVHMSPWPLTASFAGLILMYSMSHWFHMNKPLMLLTALILIPLNMLCWWRDVTREASYCGSHTKKVQQGLEWGMILFIMSEVMFFSAFFWAFFHSSLAPTLEIGCSWPPTGTWPLNPFSIPLLNTAILLSSGVTVTYAHHALLSLSNSQLITSLLMTVALGWYFTALQGMEYMDTSFSIADSIYGSTFFIATGFHGLHVLIGSMFLLTCLKRSMDIHFSNRHHFGFEAAAWYWHFVDVVWIMLFLSMYWWATN